MTIRLSNAPYLTVLDPIPLENIGWEVRVLSERDYASQVALVSRFTAMGFTKERNAEGGGSISLDADDPIFTQPLPSGETTNIINQEALWQFYEDGIWRFEMLAEDLEEDVIPEGGGPRSNVFSGRGTALVLDWAKVLPAGMPTPTTMTRKFNLHPMAVFATLFAEAKAAGYLTWCSLTFDTVNDSAAQPWGAVQAVEVQAGESLLDLLKRWCEALDLTWKMLPGFRIHVMKATERHLESTVVFTQYKGQISHGRQVTRREVATDVYAVSGDKGIARSSDGAAAIKWRKRMLWVDAGDASDATGRSAVANSTLALVKDQKASRAVKVPAADVNRRVFVDYDLNDWVMIETPENTAESGAQRVMAITIDVDVDAKVDVELTMQSRWESRQEKIKRALDKLGAQAAASAPSSSPIQVTTAISATKVEDLSNVDVAGIASGDVLGWNGAKWVDMTIAAPVLNLDGLTDVDTTTVAPTNGQTMVFDSVAGLWKPGTIAVGGGGGGGTAAGVSVVPRMSDFTWFGYVASASAYYSPEPRINPWAAFRDDQRVGGWLNNGALPSWLKIKLPVAAVVSKYGIQPWLFDTGSSRWPYTWTFEGSNDDIAWTVLDTRTAFPIASYLTSGLVVTPFSIATPASFAYYRLNVTANNGNGYTGIQYLGLYM